MIDRVADDVGQNLRQPVGVPVAKELPPNVAVHLGARTSLQLLDDLATDFENRWVSSPAQVRRQAARA